EFTGDTRTPASSSASRASATAASVAVARVVMRALDGRTIRRLLCLRVRASPEGARKGPGTTREREEARARAQEPGRPGQAARFARRCRALRAQSPMQ